MRIWCLATLAAFGMTLAGWDTGMVAGAMASLSATFGLSDLQQGLVVAVALCGAGVGSFIGGALAQRFGARKTIIGLGIAYALVSAVAAMAEYFTEFLVARFVIGLIFGSTAIVPIYVADISPPDKRGALVSLVAIFTALSIVAAYLVGKAVIDAGGSWRHMLALGIGPGLLTALGLFVLPESPRQLIAWNRAADARRALAFFNGEPAIDENVELAPVFVQATGNKRAQWALLLTPSVRPTLIVGIAITFFQQASGINAVLYFAPRVFAGTSGATGPMTATVGAGVINLLATLVATILVDRAGRRTLLLWGTTAMALILLAIAASFWFGASIISLIILLCGFVAAYAVGLGAVPWILLSELFPTAIRQQAVSLAVVTLWTTNLAVAGAFPWLTSHLGTAGTFLSFAGISALGAVFIARHVPETKGRRIV